MLNLLTIFDNTIATAYLMYRFILLAKLNLLLNYRLFKPI